MTAEAIYRHEHETVDVLVPTGGYASGEVIQLTDGRAGVVAGLTARAAGDTAAVQVCGRKAMQKVAAKVCIKGLPAYWDRSAGKVSPIKDLASGDFEVGVFAADAEAAATEVDVHLNVKPNWLIDLHRDAFESVIVLTAGTPDVKVFSGGATQMKFSATAEAQKVDLLSKNSLPVSVPFIAWGRVAVYDIGDNAALDLNIGVANATHATDCDAITESCFLHLDGTALDIKAESDDGPTEVAATDTTVDAVDDTYFDFAIDGRNLSDIQLYVNGVNVLPSSVFKLNAATGPLKLLAHMEKTSDDTPGDVRVAELALLAFDVAN